jgi:hypothetical protein
LTVFGLTVFGLTVFGLTVFGLTVFGLTDCFFPTLQPDDNPFSHEFFNFLHLTGHLSFFKQNSSRDLQIPVDFFIILSFYKKKIFN